MTDKYELYHSLNVAELLSRHSSHDSLEEAMREASAQISTEPTWEKFSDVLWRGRIKGKLLFYILQKRPSPTCNKRTIL